MNSVTLRKGDTQVAMTELTGGVVEIELSADNGARRIWVELDHADMAALMVFHRAYQLGRIHLTPGGDAETEGGD